MNGDQRLHKKFRLVLTGWIGECLRVAHHASVEYYFTSHRFVGTKGVALMDKIERTVMIICREMLYLNNITIC